eukprot:SAG31_NODE_575_length_13961_cov_41.577550_4_plen_86_part_00
MFAISSAALSRSRHTTTACKPPHVRSGGAREAIAPGGWSRLGPRGPGSSVASELPAGESRMQLTDTSYLTHYPRLDRDPPDHGIR